MNKIRWAWCFRWGIALGLVVGLLILLAGCSLSAIYGVDPSAVLGAGIR